MQERCTGSHHSGSVTDNLSESFILSAQSRMLESVLESEKDPVARKRLFDKIECAATRGFNCIRDGAVAGDHDHRRVVFAVSQKPQQIDAVSVGQFDVE